MTADEEDANAIREEARDSRSTEHDVAPLIVERWSPRSMTGEHLAEDEFMPLFEAARWAPSSLNRQPWRYRYAAREGDDWEAFFGLLSEGNQRWATRASLLVVVLSERADDDGRPIRNGSFSTGASWQNLALEGTRRGLVVHPMQGFDREATREVLGVPESLRVEIMTAIGPKAPKDALEERDRERETASDRKPLEEIVSAGGFAGG